MKKPSPIKIALCTWYCLSLVYWLAAVLLLKKVSRLTSKVILLYHVLLTCAFITSGLWIHKDMAEFSEMWPFFVKVWEGYFLIYWMLLNNNYIVN